MDNKGIWTKKWICAKCQYKRFTSKKFGGNDIKETYKSNRIINGKLKWIIEDESGNIIDKNPDKGKLEHLTVNKFNNSYNNYKFSKGFSPIYTDEELLDFLRIFYQRNYRIPAISDFTNNPLYPGKSIYSIRFGRWKNALIKAGLVRSSEYIYNSDKGRLFEIVILKIFNGSAKDLSGDCYTSHYDGICPKGQIYDAKSVALVGRYWPFNLNTHSRCEIEFYYLGAFDENYSNLLHVWRIPGNFIDGNSLTIGIDEQFVLNIYNMKEHEITEKYDFDELLKQAVIKLELEQIH